MPACKVLEWGHITDLGALREVLQAGKAECLAVNRVPNSRLLREFQAAALMTQPNAPRTVRELRDLLEGSNPGVDPEDVWALERELPYDVHVSWPVTWPPDCFDVMFQPKTKSGLIKRWTYRRT
jgi:hypothetical protein